MTMREPGNHSMPDEGSLFYCLGLHRTEAPDLSAKERAALEECLAEAERQQRAFRLFVKGVLIVGVVGLPLWLWSSDDPEEWWKRVLIFALAWWPLAFGGLGSLAEALVGWGRYSRWFFRVLWIAFGAGLALQTLGVSNADAIYMLAFFALALGGMFVSGLRWAEQRHGPKVVEALRADLERGTLWKFAGQVSADIEDSRALKRAGLRTGCTLDALLVAPRSKVVLLVHQHGGQPSDFKDWRLRVGVEEVAAAVESLGVPAELPEELRSKFHGELRHLAGSEKAELERHCARLLKRAGAGFLVAAFITAQVVRLVENMLAWHLQPGLSPAGWSVAILAGLVWAGFWLLFRARVARAAKFGRVLVVEPKTGEESAPRLEVLFGDLAWSEQGEPAPWRRQPW